MPLTQSGAERQVTKVKLEQKQREGIAEARSGRRSPVSDRTRRMSVLPRTFTDQVKQRQGMRLDTGADSASLTQLLLPNQNLGGPEQCASTFAGLSICQNFLIGKQASAPLTVCSIAPPMPLHLPNISGTAPW